MRLAVLEELRASYGIKVKSGSFLVAAKQPGAAAAEVRGAVTLRRSRRAPAPGAGRGGGARRLPLREQSSRRSGSRSSVPRGAGRPPVLASVTLP